MGIFSDICNDIDATALRLMTEMRGFLLLKAKELVEDSGLAEDLVMRTIERAIVKSDTFDASKGSLRSWLFRIMRNLAATDCRRKDFAVSRPSPEGDDMLDEIPDDSAVDEVAVNDDSAYIRSVIESLPRKFRDVIVLHYFEEMPLAEVAKVLSIPSGTVASRIHFAKKVLSAKLGGIVSSRSIRRSISLFAALLGAAALGFAAVKAGLPELLFSPAPQESASVSTAAENAADSPPAVEETPGETVIEATVASDREQDMKTNELTVAKTLAVSAILSLSSVRAETDAYGNEIAYSSDGETVEYKFWHSNSTSEEMSGEDSSTAVSTEPVSVDSRSFSRGACTGRIVTTPAPPEGFLVIVK